MRDGYCLHGLDATDDLDPDRADDPPGLLPPLDVLDLEPINVDDD